MTQTAHSGANARLSPVDSLRGIAALAVFLFHARGAFFRSVPGAPDIWRDGISTFLKRAPAAFSLTQYPIGFGDLGVPLFFVISGFCIHLPFAKRARQVHFWQFFRRRMLRLYPLYAAVCAVAFLLAGLRGHTEILNLRNVFGHVIFWHYSFPPSAQSHEATIVIWSLALEVQFYLFYAVLNRPLRSIGIARCALFALALGVAYRIGWDAWHDSGTLLMLSPRRFSPARFGEWLLGAWIADAYVKGIPVRSRWGTVRLQAAALFVVTAGIATVVALGLDRAWADIPASVASALLLLSLVRPNPNDEDVRSTSVIRRGATWLGSRSYSLYMVHFMTLATVAEVAARVLHIRNKDAVAGTPLWGAVIAAGMLAALCVTEVAFRLIERPSHELARKFRDSQPEASAQRQPQHVRL